MNNRRKHKRISFLKEVEISCRKEGAVKALAANISRNGIVAYCNKPLAVGGELAIKLPFVDEYKVDRIEVIIGDVCWTKPFEDFYVVGIEFRPLNEHDHFMLLAYLNYAEGFENPRFSE